MVFGDKWTVTLGQDHDLLLDVFYFILSLLQVYDLYCQNFFSLSVDSLEHFTKRPFADPLQFGEPDFWVDIDFTLRKTKTST